LGKGQCVVFREDFNTLTTAASGGWQLSQRGDACHAKWYISDREAGRPANTPCADYRGCNDKTLHIGQNDNFLCQELSGPDAGCGDCGAWQIESSIGCPRLNYSTQAEAISPVIRLTGVTDSVKIEFDYLAGLRGSCNTPTGDYAQVFYRTSTNNGATFGPWINLMPFNNSCLPATPTCRTGTSEDGVMTSVLKMLSLAPDINALQLRYTWNSYDDCNGIKLTTVAIDNIKVTAYPRGGIIAIDVGGDQLRVCQSTVWLNASLPGGAGVWSQVAGPPATIQRPNEPITLVSGLTPNNSYQFRWTVGSACGVVLVTTNSGAPPTLNAGPDQDICANNTTLNATPTAASPRGWRVLRQPPGANAVFSNVSAPNASITGLNQEGEYVLEWLAFSGCCIGRDTVVIRVKRETVPAFAGNDTSICGDSFLLNAAPIPTSSVGKWSIIEQPAGSSASIAEPTRSTTRVEPLKQGVYKFVWEVAGGCGPSSKDTLTLKVEEPTFSFFAGADSATCLSQLSLWAELLGAGLSGVWLVLQQPAPGANSISIAEPNKPNSRIELRQEGEYQLLWRVTDGNCTMQDTLHIKYDKNLFRIDTLSTVRPICKALGGEIKLLVSSPSPVISIKMQPDTGTRDGLFHFKLLPSGSYAFEAKNQEGCSAQLRVDLPAITPPILLSAKETKPAGCRQANGSLVLEAQGGISPYTFRLGSPPQTNQTGIFNGLAAGRYPIQVEDANGCVADTAFYIPSEDFEIQQTQIIAPACHGANTGKITVLAAGNSGPFLYTLEPINRTNTTGIFTGLPAATYTVTVLDRNSCPITLTPLVLAAPPKLELSWTTQAPGCTTPSGVIALKPSGGLPPYNFDLFPNAGRWADSAFINLPAGAYKLSLKDQNGCRLDTLVALNPVTDIEIIITPANIIPASCKGKADGQVLAQVRSSIPIQSYSIFPPLGNNLQNGIFTDLPGGAYIITATDAVGCSHSKEVIIPERSPFEILVIGKQDLLCAQTQDGEIQLAVSGNAQPPFAFSIDGGASTFASANTEWVFGFLQPGEYTPWVRDARGCIVTLPPLKISAPLPLRWALKEFNSPRCPGSLSGRIKLEAQGGTLPYNYTLTSLQGQTKTQSTGEFLNLAADKYWVDLVDANGCELSVTDYLDLTLSEPLSAEVLKVYPPLCLGEASGSIKLKVINANAPWKIRVSPGNYVFENTDSLTKLSARAYHIVLQDASGCEYALPDSVSIPSPLPLGWESFTAEPPNCFNGQDGSLQVKVRNAALPLSFSLRHQEGQELKNLDGNFIKMLKSGVYTLALKDNNGCSLDTSFTLPNPEAIIALPDTVLCIGQTGGNRIVPLVAKQGNTVLNNGTWSGPGVEGLERRFVSGLVNDTPGTYTPEFTSEKGCKAKAKIEIVNLQVASFDTLCYGLETYQPPAPNLSGGNWRALSAELRVNPVTGAIENISQAPSGNYFLVYQAGGCQDTLALHILPRIEGNIVTSPLEDALYPNQPITFSVSGNYATIFWDFGLSSEADDTSRANTPVFRYPEKGNYTVRALITDARGCRRQIEKELQIRWLLDPFIPNVITPNGDGVNDAVELNFSSLISVTFTVFDAWGKQIFQTVDPKGRWEPRKNDLNSGTYYYLLQFENPENGQKHTKTGNIAIIY
jgi:gliding motility-associated-like protein